MIMQIGFINSGRSNKKLRIDFLIDSLPPKSNFGHIMSEINWVNQVPVPQKHHPDEKCDDLSLV